MGNQLSSDGSVVSSGFTKDGVRERSAENDDELLKQIAQARSEDAFDVLYQRYHKRLYNVAYYMTRNEHMAQDATQQALVDLWISAKNYRSGNAKGWITMILVRNILDRRKSRQGEIKRIGRRAQKGFPERVVATPPQQLEQRERMKGLRCGLARLGAQDRSLVALYFGGELSQAEIGRITGMPQTTVSSHIKRITKDIQEHCSKVGLLGVGGVSVFSWIGEAIVSGHNVPNGMFNEVLSRIETVEKGQTSNVGGTATLSLRWFAGLGIIILGLGVFAYAMVNQAEGVSASVTVNSTATIRPHKKLTQVPLSPQEVPSTAVWNLNLGRNPDSDVHTVLWELFPVSKTRSERMATVPAKEVIFRLPPFSSRYFHLKAKASGVSKPHGDCTIFYDYDSKVPGYRSWRIKKHLTFDSQNENLVFDFYRNDRFTVRCINGDMVQILEEPEVPTGVDARILIYIHGITLERLELSYLNSNTVPKKFRNPIRFIDKSWFGPEIRKLRIITPE